MGFEVLDQYSATVLWKISEYSVTIIYEFIKFSRPYFTNNAVYKE